GFIEKRLSGGGALLDIGVHIIDLAWWLMGCPMPQEVSGVTSNRLAQRPDLGSEWGQWNAAQIDVEDFAAGLIRFANGAALAIEASWLAFQPDPEITRLQLFGTQGGAVWPEGLIVGETDRIPWDLQLGAVGGERAHHESIRQFALSIVNETPLPIPLEQT